MLGGRGRDRPPVRSGLLSGSRVLNNDLSVSDHIVPPAEAGGGYANHPTRLDVIAMLSRYNPVVQLGHRHLSTWLNDIYTETLQSLYHMLVHTSNSIQVL